jgi:hypothetical protein
VLNYDCLGSIALNYFKCHVHTSSTKYSYWVKELLTYLLHIINHLTICGLPKCTSNIATQLPHDLFGIKVFSLKNVYLQCIGEQLQHALNDTGRIRKIYNGLLQFILATFGGAEEIPCIKYHHCVRSPITKILFLLKKEAGVHLKSTMDNFIFNTSPIENVWMTKAQNLHGLYHTTSLKLLQKLLLHNIMELGQITLPNGLNIMSPNDFKNIILTLPN